MSEPETRRLGHGISVIPLPLPFPNPSIVNAYVIEGEDGLVLLDCGADWEPGSGALAAGLDLLGLDPGAVHTLVVTHLHPDHVGMAPRVTEELGCRLLMHSRAATLYRRYNDTAGFAERVGRLARRHGVPASHLEELTDVGRRPPFMPTLRPPDVVVDDGDAVPLGAGRSLEVLHTPGHEQSHICLRDSRTGILFSGDHVLPRITPVIQYDEEVADVLGDYLRSLRRVIGLEVGLTYPAHGALIERGTMRAEQIVLHHRRRLAGMEEVVGRGPLTAWSVMTQVYRPHLSPTEQRLALAETVAHLEHLRLSQQVGAFEEGGRCWYRRP